MTLILIITWSPEFLFILHLLGTDVSAEVRKIMSFFFLMILNFVLFLYAAVDYLNKWETSFCENIVDHYDILQKTRILRFLYYMNESRRMKISMGQPSGCVMLSFPY